MPTLSKIVSAIIGNSFTNLTPDAESNAYCGCDFQMGPNAVKFRQAKTTPTKNGQFVTLWKRNGSGITAPFDFTDDFDFCMIAVTEGTKRGLFVFPKSVLTDKGVVASENNKGKRGFRVYPNWDRPQSKQAAVTQQWQTKNFTILNGDSAIESKKLLQLLKPDQ